MAFLRIAATGTDDKPVSGMEAGTIAIWDPGDGTNWNPAIDPINNLSAVKFHNALRYKRITGVVKHTDGGMSSVSIAATAETAVLNQKTTLFAHGLGYRPKIVGSINNDSYVQPCAGSVIPLISGNPVPHFFSARFVYLTVDATNVYLVARGWYSQAVTLGWTVWIFDEEFQPDEDDNLLFKFTPSAGDFAAIGPIDAEHRFIREVESGPGELRVLGKQTMTFTNSGGFPLINYSDGAVDGSIRSVNNDTYPAGSHSVTGTETEIVGTPVSEDAGFYLDPPMRLIDGDGNVIFTTEKAMLAGLRHYSGSINTSSHAPTGTHTTRFSTDHFIGAAAGGDILFGWMTIGDSGKFLPVGEVCDFSGTVVIDGAANKTSGFALIIYALIAVSLKVSGGNVYLVEHGWSHSHTTPSIPGVTIPAMTVNYEIYAGKMVGGD
jgi:hypothetical protein